MASRLDTLNESIEEGTQFDLVHKFTEDQAFDASGAITLEGKKLSNFGSCSYLGLEDDPALKAGVMDAVTRYGTQFSSSRTYLSLGLYQELERSLSDIFDKPVLVSASTTLGHLATIPVLVGDGDAVILDMQVHNSIQMTVQQLKARKVPIYLIPHNDMEALENKIRDLGAKHDKVWYFADGVYSMYGDYAPFAKLEQLLNQHKKFHLYIDDAHGMSWAGQQGSGVVRQHIAHHDRMVLAVSLNKAFAAAGGCMVFPNEAWAQQVRNCGPTYIFCGPIQPPMLGAACASVRLHQSDDFQQRQAHLQTLIAYTNRRLTELGLPQYQVTDSPLFFIPVGLPRTIVDILQGMKKDGFYLNSASFPALPMKKGGLRFMINNRLSIAEIEAMLVCMQFHYRKVMQQHRITGESIAKTFGIAPFTLEDSPMVEGKATTLSVQTTRSIRNWSAEAWDSTFAERGNLAFQNLALLEDTFSGNDLPEHNWSFHYLHITDGDGATVLKTFCTLSLTKDDMLQPGHVSEKVEQNREIEPYYLTSHTLMTGSPVTKGEHVYLNRTHAQWKEALSLLIEHIEQLHQTEGADQLIIRDFLGEQDAQVAQHLRDLGFIPSRLLDNMVVANIDWSTTEEYLSRLGGKYRYNVRKEVLQHTHKYIVTTEKPSTEAEIRELYGLYEQVFDRAYALNVFKLPFSYFKAMCEDPHHDVLQLYLKPEYLTDSATVEASPKRIGVMFSYRNATEYHAAIVGLDYEYVRSHNAYKQILYQTVCRAHALGYQTIDLGFTAELEKKKLGARPQPVYAYVQLTEHDQMVELETL